MYILLIMDVVIDQMTEKSIIIYNMYAAPWCIFLLVKWLITQHRQCVQINGSISRHNSLNGHDEILNHKVSFL